MRGPATRKPFVTPTFAVDDTGCGNRVGTDGILLGLFAAARWRGRPGTSAAAVATSEPRRVLDIGVGCGIVALTWLQDALGWVPATGGYPGGSVVRPFGPAVQRAVAVEGWDLDRTALQRFEHNCIAACAANRASHVVETSAVHIDVAACLATRTDGASPSLGACGDSDVIVCNPPFFERAAMLPRQYDAMPQARRWARLRSSLDVGDLAAAVRYKLRPVSSLDAPGGAFVIYPFTVAREFAAAVDAVNRHPPVLKDDPQQLPRLIVKEIIHVWDTDADRLIAAPELPIATAGPDWTATRCCGTGPLTPQPTRTLLHVVLSTGTGKDRELATLPRIAALSLHVGDRDRRLSATYEPWALRVLRPRAK